MAKIGLLKPPLLLRILKRRALSESTAGVVHRP